MQTVPYFQAAHKGCLQFMRSALEGAIVIAKWWQLLPGSILLLTVVVVAVAVGFLVLPLLLLVFRSGVFCALRSDVFITKAHEFYLARKRRSAPLLPNWWIFLELIFSAPLAATCRQMPQREREEQKPDTAKLCGEDYENCLHNTSAWHALPTTTLIKKVSRLTTWVGSTHTHNTHTERMCGTHVWTARLVCACVLVRG